MRAAGEDFVIVDGRPFAEYRKMSIPGGICCPNGELVLRIRDIAPDPRTKIVVNCAGRTRSIIGAQTLIDFGVPNPVFALENGTQGWFLAGLALEHGARAAATPTRSATADLAALRSRARRFAERVRRGLRRAGRRAWPGSRDETRTTYLLRRAHRGGVCSERPAGLRARSRRPARPGDRPMGRGQRGADRAGSTTSRCGRR